MPDCYVGPAMFPGDALYVGQKTPCPTMPLESRNWGPLTEAESRIPSVETVFPNDLRNGRYLKGTRYDNEGFSAQLDQAEAPASVYSSPCQASASQAGAGSASPLSEPGLHGADRGPCPETRPSLGASQTRNDLDRPLSRSRVLELFPDDNVLLDLSKTDATYYCSDKGAAGLSCASGSCQRCLLPQSTNQRSAGPEEGQYNYPANTYMALHSVHGFEPTASDDPEAGCSTQPYPAVLFDPLLVPNNNVPWSPYCRRTDNPQFPFDYLDAIREGNPSDTGVTGDSYSFSSTGSQLTLNSSVRCSLHDSDKSVGTLNPYQEQPGNSVSSPADQRPECEYKYRHLSPPLSQISGSDASPTTQSTVSALSPSTSTALVCGRNGCTVEFTGEYRRGNVARHIRVIHGKKQYPCEHGCEKVFKRQDARLKHYRGHHPELALGPPQRRK